MRNVSKIVGFCVGGVLLVALAAGAGAVTPTDKSQERLFHPGAITLCEAADDTPCPVVSEGELEEHGVRYSTIVIMNADQERTTLLRVRGVI